MKIDFEGNKLYSVSEDQTIIVWDVSSGLVIKKIDYFTDQLITGFCLNEDKKVFYTRQQNDKIIRTWDMTNVD